MKKTVLEWLSEAKLLDKKIEKKENELLSKSYSISFKHENVVYKEDEVKSSYQSLITLKENRDKIKNALMIYNATTSITIGKKTMSIVYALSKLSNKNKFFEKIQETYDSYLEELENKKEIAQREINSLDKQLLTKNNISEKDRAFLEVAKSGYEVIIHDPLNIVELFSKEQDEEDEFNREVHNKINILNATTYLDIDIK